jgi:hypothetical protein
MSGTDEGKLFETRAFGKVVKKCPSNPPEEPSIEAT